MYKRKLDLALSSKHSCFLWGPRQTGKSTLLKTLFPQNKRYDLLLSTEYRRLVLNPSLLREECLAGLQSGDAPASLVIIDEVQKVPELLDEVHWLIENHGLLFILCGSSARKLKRGGANLLGGRAVSYQLYPLVFPEIPGFSLERAANFGRLPPIYPSDSPDELLRSYVGDYLQEEIAAEALTRNIPAFSRFLEVAALSNGELINYSNIASECGVSPPTVKEYYQILVDTLVGFYLPAFSKRAKRRLIRTPKFYLFDPGVAAHLTRRGPVHPRSELFGKAFEHLIITEIRAHSAYSRRHYPLAYWRTASGYEVDLVLGDREIAVEIKSTAMVRNRHLKGIRAFMDESPPRRAMVVSLDPNPRRTEDEIEITPWRRFLEHLWEDRIL